MTVVPFCDRAEVDDRQLGHARSLVAADWELAILIRRAIAKMCHTEPDKIHLTGDTELLARVMN